MIQETEICLGAKKKLNPSEILMLKSDANYTYVYLVDGTKFLSSITLGKLAKRLEDFSFMRPNRSVLINCQFITNINFNNYVGHSPYILLANKQIVPIARRKTLLLQKEFKTV